MLRLSLALALVAAALPARATPFPTGTPAVLTGERPAEAPTRGPREAAVTVEIFCNFAHVQCPLTERRLRDLAERHPGGLRIVYRQVVLPFKDSATIAEATLEAWTQGRFAELDDLVAAAGAPVRVRDLDTLAARAGLDVGALHAALADHRHAAAVERDAVRRDRLGVGSFALVWNGVAQSPELSADGFERAYAEAEGRARALAEEGVAPGRVFALMGDLAARARARDAAGALDQKAPRVHVPTAGAPARGAADPLITIVVFGAFECPFCRRQADLLGRLRALYPDEIRVVWKHLPPTFSPTARAAAELAACADLQGRFWELHDAFLAPGTRFYRNELEQVAAKAGLDLPRLRSDLASGRCGGRVDADLADARAAGAEAAPTLFVNGLRLTGAQGLGSLRLLVEAELAPGLLETLTAPRP